MPSRESLLVYCTNCVSILLCSAAAIVDMSSTRRLESFFNKYVISADMTYTKLSSFITLLSFVVTTSYNIGLPGTFRCLEDSDPGCEIWSHCHTKLRATESVPLSFARGCLLFKIPRVQFARVNFAQYH